MKILKLKEVIVVTALSRSSIYSLVRMGNFPKPIKLSERSVGWVESEVTEFLSQRAEMRGKK